MTKDEMKNILGGIQSYTEDMRMTRSAGDDSCIVFIKTYNKLRKKALEEGWIDGDIIMELDLNDDSLFGTAEERANVEIIDIIGAAAMIFKKCL